MSTVYELHASHRSDVGKGASRRLRHEDKIPAILYGAKEAPMNLALSHKDVSKSLTNEAFYSHILTLHVDGETFSAVIKAMQRHPYQKRIMHMDFLRINLNEAITMNVPLHFAGEEIAPGVKIGGGKLMRLLSTVEIECLPRNLPEFIKVDVSKCELGDSIHLSDLQLPEGVELVDLKHGNDQTVANLTMIEEAPIETAAPVAAGEVPSIEVKKEEPAPAAPAKKGKE